MGKALAGMLLLLAGLQPVFGDQTEIRNYSQARTLFWESLYPDSVHTIYCDKLITKGSLEHVLPASWMKTAADCVGMNRSRCRSQSERFNHMEADLHNLYPALSIINNQRSDYPFGIIPGSAAKGQCDFEYDVKARRAEPRPAVRGDLARSVLYMAKEYGVDLIQESKDREYLNLMTYWHCSDPVSQNEMERNDTIEQLEGNRNPYIDQPELIDCSRVHPFPED